MDILYKFNDEEFVWNEKKARDNRRKHGIALKKHAKCFSILSGKAATHRIILKKENLSLVFHLSEGC